MKAASPEINFPALDHEVLRSWDEEQVFYRSIAWRKDAEEFTFYDGPPFANGLPHYGHLLASTIKDVVPRYWTMRGYLVKRRFGWDCHGVPVEFEVEKQEGLKGREDILKMGVTVFNEKCRTSVMNYTKDWQETITRIGRWVDWQDQYRTMDRDFMESVWWVLGELHSKGLLYKDFKVVPYSPRITAVLSNFEANQNYKEVQDPAVTVKFKLTDEDAYVLAWTTTPWTLVSNLALCVGPEIDYVKIKDQASGESWYVAEARLTALYKKQLGKSKGDQPIPYKVIQKVSAAALAGRRYEPLFPYFAGHPQAFQILTGDYVTTDNGTGIVHQAPAFGEDDFLVCRAAGIDIVDPVDENGKFDHQVPDFQGQYIKDADKEIAKHLKDRGLLARQEVIVHSYPFCERSDAPLIYKAVTTWYVAVEKIKDQMLRNHEQTTWVPEHLKAGRMGKWLENARDWAISRNRFWGTPIPIWLCDKDDQHMEVISSVEQLEARAQTSVADLHIHYVNKLSFGCKQCDGQMHRIAEVFDCWFESGSMPYAQRHYPFENEADFDQRFPADFIAEGLDQTRGWFYTLAVLSTALFDRPAFKNVVVNGLVLAGDGKKMSKRLKNYTPPVDLLDRFGADAVRLYMLNSPVLKAGDLAFTDEGVRDTVRMVLLPFWNAYSFLSTYAAADGWMPSKAAVNGDAPKVEAAIDRWIISRFETLCARIQEEMEGYRLYAVVPPVVEFIEDLTNWYIRLSRKRFWGTAPVDALSSSSATTLTADSQAAYETLYYVMVSFSKVFAPFAPFITERIYQGLTESARSDLRAIKSGNESEDPSKVRSVHLQDYPIANESRRDTVLERRMEVVRKAANLGRSLRAKHSLRIRQPLASMMVITSSAEDQAAIELGQEILKTELNIKEITFSDDESRHVRLSLKPNLKTLGRRFGKRLGEVRKHLSKLNEDPSLVASLLGDLATNETVSVLGEDLGQGDFLVERGPIDERLIATDSGVTVLLNTELTEDLKREGLAREVVNRVQNLRKDSGLEVTDRIHLRVESAESLLQAVTAHEGYIAQETLAKTVTVKGLDPASGAATKENMASKQILVDIEGTSCLLSIEIAVES